MKAARHMYLNFIVKLEVTMPNHGLGYLLKKKKKKECILLRKTGWVMTENKKKIVIFIYLFFCHKGVCT